MSLTLNPGGPVGSFAFATLPSNANICVFFKVYQPMTLDSVNVYLQSNTQGDITPVVYKCGSSTNLAAGSSAVDPTVGAYTSLTIASPPTLTPGMTYAVGFNPATPADLTVGTTVQTASLGQQLVAVLCDDMFGNECPNAPMGAGYLSDGTWTAMPYTGGIVTLMVGMTVTLSSSITVPAISMPYNSVQLSPTAPFADPDWFDISEYVESFTTNAGRNHELLTTEASTCKILVDNRNAAFFPWNTDSPYAGLLVPTMGVQVTAIWDGVAYPVFTGYVDSFIPKWSDPMSTDMTIAASDSFGLLAVNYMASDLYAAAVLADGPFYYWRCNDPAGSAFIHDYAGNYNSAIPSGETLGGEGALPCDVATSINLTAPDNGVTSWNFPISTRTFNPTTSMSIECWFQFETYGSGAAIAAHYYDVSTGAESATYLMSPGDAAGPTLSTSDVPTNFVADLPTTDGNWHYFGFAYSNTDGITAFCFDGVDYTSDVLNPVTGLLGFGAYWYGNVETQNSCVANFQEVALYENVELTIDQLQAHYTTGGGDLLQVQTTGEAIVNGLSLIGVPPNVCSLTAGGGQVQPGQSEIQPPGGGNGYATSQYQVQNAASTSSPLTLTSTDGLSYVQSYGTAEAGFLFVDPRGRLTFYDRYAPIETVGLPSTSWTNQATLEDAATSTYFYLIDQFSPGLDNLDLWNEFIGSAQATVPNPLLTGATQIVENAASQDLYGKRTYSQQDGLLYLTDADVLSFLQWLASLYGTPIPRVRSINLSAAAASADTPGSQLEFSSTTEFNSTLPFDGNTPPVAGAVGINLPIMLGLGLWNLVTVIHHGLVGGTEFSQQALIEGIAHTVDAKRGWTTTLRLSPAETNIDYLVLNNGTYGVINGSNVLAF